jgi:hypothetical protein
MRRVQIVKDQAHTMQQQVHLGSAERLDWPVRNGDSPSAQVLRQGYEAEDKRDATCKGLRNDFTDVRHIWIELRRSSEEGPFL